jgi:hypothetical protein
VTQAEVLQEVAAERARQDAKWGVQHHKNPMWVAILVEEVGEAAALSLSDEYGTSLSDREKLRQELIQVAAVAVAFIECLDRNPLGTAATPEGK